MGKILTQFAQGCTSRKCKDETTPHLRDEDDKNYYIECLYCGKKYSLNKESGNEYPVK